MVRSTRKTILICGEGKSELALVSYFRTTFTSGKKNPPKITPKQAGGKGGNNVVDTLLGQAACATYDEVVALIDLDLPPSPAKRKQAKARRVRFIEFQPCLEGFLLKILDKPAPENSAACKEKLWQLDPREVFEKGYFADNFPRQVLEQRRLHVPELDALLRVFGT